MQSTRYAHTEGYTDICYAEDGKQFLTCGEDGDVRIWQSFDDIDSVSISIGEKCTSIAQKQNKFYVANELNEIKKYDLNTHEFEELITTFTLPVNTMAVNKSNTQLVCGADDFEIRLVDLATLKYTTFTGHTAPILHICIDPLEKYFLSSGCDGTIRIWSIKNLNSVKVLQNMNEKSSDFSCTKTYAKISWHKDGNLIAIPSNKQVQFYERELWQLKFKIETDDNVSVTQFAPDGKHILLCTSTNWFYVHSIITKTVLFKYEHAKKGATVCSIAWNTAAMGDCGKNEILFCDLKGQMGCLKVNLNDEQPTVAHDELNEAELLEILNDDGDSNSTTATTTTTMEKLRSPKKKRKRLASNDEDSNDTVIKSTDDEESLEKLKEKTFNEIKREMELRDDDIEMTNDHETKSDAVQIVQQQPQKRLVYQHPFQCTAMPVCLDERFMCFNTIGTITQFNTDSDKSIIIEFHNVTYHHTIHIHNTHDAYTMASFCKEAIVLASPGKYAVQNDEDEVVYQSNDHSKLTCILLNPWDSSNKEWSIQMPRKESIQCICVSDKLCACVTNNRFLRVFTHNGIQRELIALAMLNVVTMAAYGNCVFVCYYKAYSYSIDEHVISYSFVYLNEATNEYRIENGDLALSDKAKLAWIGFSDEGNPYYYDTNGYLYTQLTRSSSNGSAIWTPICNLRTTLKHKSDNYWLVGVSERTQNIKAIQCRSSQYPKTLIPKPTIQLVQFQIPLCELNADKTQFEHDLQRSRILLNNLKTLSPMENFDQDDIDELNEKLLKQVRENLMKMFANACKANKEQRAYEYAQLMDTLTLQLAIKYATKSRYLQLAQHLNGLADIRATLEAAAVVEQPQYDLEPPTRSFQRHNEDIEVISESRSMVTQQTTTQYSTYSSTAANDDSIIYTNTTIADSTAGTPSALTNTRFNPFKTRATPNTGANPLAGTFQTATCDSTQSPSILTEIEDKLNKQQNKEKNVWKPTPTRGKLTKSKVTGATPSNGNGGGASKLDSFFGSVKKASENLKNRMNDDVTVDDE